MTIPLPAWLTQFVMGGKKAADLEKPVCATRLLKNCIGNRFRG